MRPLTLLTPILALAGLSSAQLGRETAENDGYVLLRACASQVIAFQASHLKAPEARSCSDPALQVFALEAELAGRKLDRSLETEIDSGPLGSFTVDLRLGTGEWLSYTHDLSGERPFFFLSRGRAPFTPSRRADRQALSRLRACDWSVKLYAGVTFDTLARRLGSCEDQVLRRSTPGLAPVNLSLESKITSREGVGYSISVKSSSGLWFSLVYREDGVELYNPPHLVPGEVTF